jgi:hypothetical protein
LRCLLWKEAGGGGMQVVETIARRLREHLVKGKTIKEIARDLLDDCLTSYDTPFWLRQFVRHLLNVKDRIVVIM